MFLNQVHKIAWEFFITYEACRNPNVRNAAAPWVKHDRGGCGIRPPEGVMFDAGAIDDAVNLPYI